MTFFHVLSVVESESAIISNTIFFAITILPFLKEYGSNNANKTRLHTMYIYLYKTIIQVYNIT